MERIIQFWSKRLPNLSKSRNIVIAIVFLAIFFDKFLLTVVVPIMANILMDGTTDNMRCLKSGNITNDAQMDTIGSNSTVTNNNDDINRKMSTSSHRECFDPSSKYAQLKIGFLFAIKAIAQLIVNPVVGTMTNRIGYSIPMLLGIILVLISTLIFAFGKSYTLLMMARATQGIGSSCSSVGGLSMISDVFPDDKERGEAIGIVLIGLALGLLAGPPYGGLMYQFCGKEITFLILVGFILINAVLQVLVLRPSVVKKTKDGSSLIELLQDPYILLIAGALMIHNFGLAITEPTLPVRMHIKMNSEVWQQGLVFTPAVISYALVSKVFAKCAHSAGRWLVGLLGMFLNTLTLISMPFTREIWHLVIPMACLGLSAAMVDSTLIPQLGYLVDIRHISIYGSVYAIADMSLSIGFSVGPAFSGLIVETLGFEWLMWIFAILCFLYAPLLVFIRNPPAKDKEQSRMLNSEGSTCSSYSSLHE